LAAQRSKEDEKEAQAASSVEEKVKSLQEKDEAAQKQTVQKKETADKAVQKKQEALQKSVESEENKKRQVQEQEDKKCIRFQVWSATWPNNVWQFKVKEQVFNKDNQGFRRGFNVMILEPKTYHIRLNRGFDTYASQDESRALADELKSAPTGATIMIACQDECSNNREINLIMQFEKLKLQFAQKIGFRQSYAAIVIKGQDGAMEQWPQNNGMASVADNINC